jgi:hypothetical protein
LLFKFKAPGDIRTRRINVHNVYNSGPNINIRGTRTLVKLRNALRAEGEHIAVGDFNLHHSLWAGEDYHHQHAEADELIEIVEEQSLQLLLPPGTITYRARSVETTLDLAFVSQNLENSLIACDVANDMDNDSDHLPVRTVLDLSLAPKEIKQARVWNKINEELLVRVLRSELPIPHTPGSREEIDHTAALISIALQQAIEAAVPLSRGCLRSVPGWTDECKEIQMECRRLKRRHQITRNSSDWDEYKRVRNRKKWVYKKALTTQHRDKVEEATKEPKGLWQLAKWAKNRSSPYQSFTPNIQGPNGLTTSPAGKAKVFKDTFFPTPPEADLRDLKDYQYPNSKDEANLLK